MNTLARNVVVLLVVALIASLAATIGAPVAHSQDCVQLLVDGGFEAGGGWRLGTSPVPPRYVSHTFHSGSRSLQLGITSGANVESFSSARQTVTIPASASQATLSFWFYAMAEAPATTDYMELALLSADGSAILAKPWFSHNDSRLWNQIGFDLSAWRGQTIQLYFNVYNDGLGGFAGLFLDDIALSTCATPPPVTPGMPSVTPTNTAVPPSFTPSPTPGCSELIRNGRFDSGLAEWEAVGDPNGVTLATDRFRSAPYALKLGSLDLTLNGLAAARQQVTIPAGFPNVNLEVWIFTQLQPGAGADFQEIALLTASGGLLFVPFRGPSNDSAWVRLQFDLSAFAGQTVFLRFAVNNDGVGGRAAMYVDDVRFTACSSGVAPTAQPTTSPTVQPTATWTPQATATWTPFAPSPTFTPGPLPEGCTELTQNGGFETGMSGWFPGNTTLLPAVVTTPILNGNYALELGSRIHNINSYSSVRQSVTAPWGYARTILSFWTYTWAESLSGYDRQQFVLLGPGNLVWATPWKVLENAQTWQQHMFEIVGVAGQTFDLYFAAVNDGLGGRTALYLDEVRLWGCTGSAFPPTTAFTSAAAPGAIPLVGEAAVSATAQTLPVPQVYPMETLPVTELRSVGTAPVPVPEWTEVAIAGFAEQATATALVAMAMTPRPPSLLADERAVQQATAAIGEPALVVTPETPSDFRPFLGGLTARWPRGWPWVVGGLLLLLLIALLFVRQRPGS